MPEKKTKRRARRAKREGKSPSTQAGEYVREEIRHVREGKHGARSTKQAIAIGLSKARQDGVALPDKSTGDEKAQDKKTGKKRKTGIISRRRSKASLQALKREGRSSVSKKALSQQAREAATRRTASERSAAARRAAANRTAAARSASGKKAAHAKKK